VIYLKGKKIAKCTLYLIMILMLIFGTCNTEISKV